MEAENASEGGSARDLPFKIRWVRLSPVTLHFIAISLLTRRLTALPADRFPLPLHTWSQRIEALW